MTAAGKLAAAAAAGLVLASATSHHGYSYAKGHPGVVAFARDHLGCPYVWGGAGPCNNGFDCSGLAMRAYAAAGISIPRTSQEQWAAGHRVRWPKPGDLIFFVGEGDGGTTTAPGHVGIVISARRQMMIDAASPGTNVREESYAGWPGFVGFTDPGA